MNPEGVARFFCARRYGGRAVPRALRAVRNAARLQPAASEQQGGRQQSGGARVPGRPRRVRHARELPAYGDHLSSDRAFPLLDQARAPERDHQPQQFVEIGEDLAKEVGVVAGDA